MADVAIITANYDRYDELKPTVQQVGLDVEWICVHDDPTLTADLGWQLVYEPRPELHPNRAAKAPKMRPWRYTDAPYSVWVDASFRVVAPTFALAMVDRVAAHPIAQFSHPWRDCIYDEAAETLQLAKYAEEHVVIDEQMAAYAYYHPTHWGLWATGVIARSHVPAVLAHGNLWANEIDNGSYQDQLSEAPMLNLTQLRPVNLEGSHLGNPWLAYEGSGRH